ncbi:MAG: GNAT family N-acetyltransferase [Caldilineales bacterium]|nr:GNAT family N-acetyltransferase [Caldilineales bacterium]
MPDIQVEVRPAQSADIERILQLQSHARHACVRYGYEDLVQMIGTDFCYIADTGPLLWGFLCASIRQPGLAQMRGLALINGWRIEEGLSLLFHPLEDALRQESVSHIMHMAVESWTASALARQQFATTDYVVNLERATPSRSLTPQHTISKARLRLLRPNEIADLTQLDNRAFDWPWQFSSGELVQLLMTTSRLMVLEHRGGLVGYACCDVNGAHAQIVRIGVDPAFHGMGFGRYLLADAIDFAASAGAATIALNTQWQNQASQRLYQGFGFRLVGRRVPVLIKSLDQLS